MFHKPLTGLLLAPLALLLTGCQKLTVLTPSGAVAAHERDLLVATFVLMLLVVVPLFVATIWVAIRYRHNNRKATYAPEWENSTKLELLIWAGPLAIVVAIGAITWVGTHTLDPYRPLAQADYQTHANTQIKPLEVDVVALNWQWLFMYPQYGIATVNQMAAPVNRPIQFSITASDVMNSFYIPALAGQIYAMPGMRTKLAAVINEAGNYTGISANYSGAGFSQMHFRFLGQSPADFKQWIEKVRAQGKTLNRENYLQLAQPTINGPVTYYAHYAPKLFGAIVNRCVKPGKLCKSEIAAIDKRESAAYERAGGSGIPMQMHTSQLPATPAFNEQQP
ncbi:MAG: ubiquinol oxidase subunit II [Sinobacteraceae bacterium]|nr:ubiquinol oxidase subunit II [Nevskiaceae bacterium]